MRSRWVPVVCLAVAAGGVAASAEQAGDAPPEWPASLGRQTLVRGPTGVASAAPLTAPSVTLPRPASEARSPMPAPPQRVIDDAVRQATFQGAAPPPLLPREPQLLETLHSAAEPSPTPGSVAVAAELVSTPARAEPADTGHAESPPSKSHLANSLLANGVAGPVRQRTARQSDDANPNITPRRDAKPSDSRRLAPWSKPQPTPTHERAQRSSPLSGGLSGLSGESVATVGAALAIVVGLLLMMAWVWRRAAPRSARPLPEEVVSVVGRVPLANRQTAQMIKVGGKLVLVSVTPDGVKPLTEVTDPEEVNHLLGLIEQGASRSASAAFREVFEELSREPAKPGFLGDEAPLVDRQKLADAYANTPGGRAHAA